MRKLVAICLILFPLFTRGEDAYWSGSASTAWTNSANWTNAAGEATLPSVTTGAVINVTNGVNPVLNLTNGAITIASLTIGTYNTATSTLTFTYADVSSKMLIVTGNVDVGSWGVITHTSNSGGSNEFHKLGMIVSNNMTIASSGKVDVSFCGPNSALGNGRRGGTHGGQGGAGYQTTTVGDPYGSVTNPVLCGKAGMWTTTIGFGGGVIRLEISGAFTNNGSVLANGQSRVAESGLAGGAGGSVFISANSIAGTGTVSVAGGTGWDLAGGGGGGRIALYTAGADFGSLSLTASAGLGALALYNGACGTIYLKKSGDTYGSLLVDGRGVALGNFGNIIPMTLLTNASYKFDTITTTNVANLAVGTNTVFDMNGCVLRSDSRTNNIVSKLILMDNGRLSWAGTWTNNGCISWYATNYIVEISGSLVVASNAILTHENGAMNWINLRLTNSDLTIDNGGAIWVRNYGYVGASGPAGYSGSTRAGGAHGGAGGTAFGGTCLTTYDSITNPVMPGGGGFYLTGPGGGVVILKVDGTITVNGVIDAGTTEVSAGATGAGGSVNINAGQFVGSGRIAVRSGNHSNDRGSGGGGRIAVIVTNAMTFGSVTMDATAGTASANKAGAAGTIYLKGTNSVYGQLIIQATVDSQRTIIGSLVTDAVVGNVALNSGAKLSVGDTQTLTVYGNWTNSAATNAITGGTVEFAGTDPVTILGGNTWSNLTVAVQDKTVYFDRTATQTVHGALSLANGPILRSTIEGTNWYLRKPGAGTYTVGKVQVKDSNASGGMAIQTTAESVNLGNNVNWLFGYVVSTRRLLIPFDRTLIWKRNVLWP